MHHRKTVQIKYLLYGSAIVSGPYQMYVSLSGGGGGGGGWSLWWCWQSPVVRSGSRLSSAHHLTRRSIFGRGGCQSSKKGHEGLRFVLSINTIQYITYATYLVINQIYMHWNMNDDTIVGRKRKKNQNNSWINSCYIFLTDLSI